MGDAVSTPSAPPAVRILFIGNSYTARNDLPGLIVRLAALADPPRRVETAAIVAGGASLKRHWNAGRALQAMGESRWDYVVLQEQSTLPRKNPVRYHEAVRLFDPEIKRHGARTALYLTWARREAPETQDAIAEAVRAIGRELDAGVVPVGLAWRAAQASDPDVALYVDDGSHPSVAGSYLAACVFCAVLLDQQPAGYAVADALALDHVLADRLHAVAGISAPKNASADGGKPRARSRRPAAPP